MTALGFLLILLLSILFLVSNRFLLLQIDEVYNERKNRLNKVYASDSIHQERDCPLV